MLTSQILIELRKAGYTIFVDGDGKSFVKRVAHGEGKIPDELAKAMTANKPAILSALTESRFWVDEHEEQRCNECNAIVIDQNLGNCSPMTCEFRNNCPYWN